jgi:hypothetical protein
MLTAVELDSELCGSTIKIENVGADWVLPSKRPAHLTAAQRKPKLLFHHRRMAAQNFGLSSFEARAGKARHVSDPYPAC